MNERGASRLLLALPLLQAKPSVGGCGLTVKTVHGERIEESILRAIKTLPPSDQTRVRELVDWVEEYENTPMLGELHRLRAPVVVSAVVPSRAPVQAPPLKPKEVPDELLMPYEDDSDESYLDAMASVERMRS